LVLKNYLVFSVLGLLCSLPAHGDFVGNGSVWLKCDSCGNGPILTDSFSSLTPTGPNTWSGQASLSDPIFGNSVSLNVSGQQSEVFTPTSFSVDLLMTGSVVGEGAGGGSAALWTESGGGIPEVFLTAPTAGQFHITVSTSETGGGFGYANPPDLEPFWDLYGTTSPIVSGGWAPTDETVAVGPGVYEFDYYLSGAFTAGPGETTDFEISQSDSLSATFTPSVPEPRWIAVIPAALLLWLFVGRASRRRRFSVS
jgi:hypothetical protein